MAKILRLWKELFPLKALLGFVADYILSELVCFQGDLVPFSDPNCDVWKTSRSCVGPGLTRSWTPLVGPHCFSSVHESCSNWALNVLSDLKKKIMYKLTFKLNLILDVKRSKK